MLNFATAERVSQAAADCFRGLEEVLRLPPEIVLHRPGYEGAWTVAEHLEHVYLANHFLLLTAAKGCRIARRRAAEAEIPPGESDLELLAPVAVPGAFQWPPPSHMIPTGKMPLSEISSGLAEQRDRCLELLSAMPRGEGRLYSIRMSVNGLGRLDMYQWLYFLVQHARYHLALMKAGIGHGDRENFRDR